MNIVNVCTYIQSDVNQNDFGDLINRINSLYADNSIDVKFNIQYLVVYYGNNCPTDIKDSDLLLCVGHGKGGFTGPPYTPTVGFNTDPPFGFGKIGMQAGAHELAHFLGFQDLYWFKGSGIPQLPEIADDIMYDPYFAGTPKFSKIVREILNMNAKRVNDKMLPLYPKARMAVDFRIETPHPNTFFEIYTRTRNFITFNSDMNTSPSATGYTDSSGTIRVEVLGGDAVDSNFDVQKIKIGGVDYWINCLLTEANYLFKGADAECRLKGIATWCKNLFGYNITSMPSGATIEVDGVPIGLGSVKVKGVEVARCCQ